MREEYEEMFRVVGWSGIRLRNRKEENRVERKGIIKREWEERERSKVWWVRGEGGWCRMGG